jgi:hypothetical protein
MFYIQVDSKFGQQAGSKRRKSILAKRVVIHRLEDFCKECQEHGVPSTQYFEMLTFPAWLILSEGREKTRSFRAEMNRAPKP